MNFNFDSFNSVSSIFKSRLLAFFTSRLQYITTKKSKRNKDSELRDNEIQFFYRLILSVAPGNMANMVHR